MSNLLCKSRRRFSDSEFTRSKLGLHSLSRSPQWHRIRREQMLSQEKSKAAAMNRLAPRLGCTSLRHAARERA